MPYAGKGYVRPSHKIALRGGLGKGALPLQGCTISIQVVFNGQFGMWKLRFGHMNRISPKYNLFSTAFKGIVRMPRGVSR